MLRRADPYLYKVLGVRKRRTLRTGNTSTSKHVTIATTIGDAAMLAAKTAHASPTAVLRSTPGTGQGRAPIHCFHTDRVYCFVF